MSSDQEIFVHSTGRAVRFTGQRELLSEIGHIRSKERRVARFNQVINQVEQRQPKISSTLDRVFPALKEWKRRCYVDLTGYHTFIPDLVQRGIFEVPGDILEIGAFVGVGTAKLAAVAKRYGKKVYAIDVFERGSDATVCQTGVSMDELYARVLVGGSQWIAYERNVAAYSAVVTTIRGDSAKVRLPADVVLCFAFIDGNHEPAYVQSDFNLAWSRLAVGGVVGFDDYGFDLPQVTLAIDEVVREHEAEISSVRRLPPKQIFLRRGRPDQAADGGFCSSERTHRR